MRYIIYGAGGIGCTIGGHLFRQGANVVLVGNRQHMLAIRDRGLRLLTGEEEFCLAIPVALTAEELWPFNPDDVVLLCAKSQHTAHCLGQLRNAGAQRDLPILCCQNSVWNEPHATRVFTRVYGVMIVIPAVFLQPGEVINPIVRKFGFVEIGRYPAGSDALCEAVSGDLQRAGFSARANDDVMRAKGAKCLGNLGNALGAITDGRGDRSEFMAGVRREAEAVWRAAGIEWEPRESFDRRVRENYGDRKLPQGYEELNAHGSSWQSLRRGTGNIEASELNGDVVRLGHMLGIPTPRNALLCRIAIEMSERNDAPGKYSVEELQSMIDAAAS